MSGGTSNGSALAWAIYLTGIGGGVSGVYALANYQRRYLPQSVREYFGLYLEGDRTTCQECGAEAQAVTISPCFGESWLNDDNVADVSIALDCPTCGVVSLD